MAGLKNSLQIRTAQTQTLTMTPQLQQAIRLLQLSTLDLCQEIQTMVEGNPMLEVDESIANANMESLDAQAEKELQENSSDIYDPFSDDASYSGTDIDMSGLNAHNDVADTSDMFGTNNNMRGNGTNESSDHNADSDAYASGDYDSSSYADGGADAPGNEVGSSHDSGYTSSYSDGYDGTNDGYEDSYDNNQASMSEIAADLGYDFSAFGDISEFSNDFSSTNSSTEPSKIAEAQIDPGATSTQENLDTLAREDNYSAKSKAKGPLLDDDNVYEGETQIGLHEHLMWQLDCSPLKGKDRLIAEAIIDAISDSGYLTESLEDICTLVNEQYRQALGLDALPPGQSALLNSADSNHTGLSSANANNLSASADTDSNAPEPANLTPDKLQRQAKAAAALTASQDDDNDAATDAAFEHAADNAAYAHTAVHDADDNTAVGLGQNNANNGVIAAPTKSGVPLIFGRLNQHNPSGLNDPLTAPAVPNSNAIGAGALLGAPLKKGSAAKLKQNSENTAAITSKASDANTIIAKPSAYGAAALIGAPTLTKANKAKLLGKSPKSQDLSDLTLAEDATAAHNNQEVAPAKTNTTKTKSLTKAGTRDGKTAIAQNESSAAKTALGEVHAEATVAKDEESTTKGKGKVGRSSTKEPLTKAEGKGHSKSLTSACSLNESEDYEEDENENGLLISLDDVKVILKLIQNYDPLGVGARTVQECLEIQLKDLAERDNRPEVALAQEVVSKYLDLLSNHDYRALCSKLGIKEDILKQVNKVIVSLNPRPGHAAIKDKTDYIVPDVLVIKDSDDKYDVILNPDALPRIKLNEQYKSLMCYARNEREKEFFKSNLQEANWFIQSIAKRNDTLLKVAKCIVDHQKAFLDYGEHRMEPLVLNDIAQEIEMHESTISRVTTEKYIYTSRGTFELKYFFSSHVSTENGGMASSTAIRAEIKSLVSGENPRRPYSDNQIANLLKEKGFCVARRTIAKYREALGIGSSSQRKRLI